MIKECKRCGIKKDSEKDFTARGKWLRGECKECRRKEYEANKEKHKARYQLTREKRLKEQKAQRLRRKHLVFNHYGAGNPKCSCCQESALEFLTIDHINGGGEKHRKEIAGNARTRINGRVNTGGGTFYRWLIHNNFPEGFRILCWNCNSAFGLFGYCPHAKV